MKWEGTTRDPVDALKAGSYGTILGGSLGLVAAATRNALTKPNVGISGVFVISGAYISSLAATGGAVTFTQAAAGNLRGRSDWKNWAAGGFAGGAIQGLFSRSIPKMLGWGAAFAVILGGGHLVGGIGGHDRVNTTDFYAEREEQRKTTRIPIEQVLVHIGEGRGIRPPGYEERRRQRLKERYGVEVNPVSVSPQ